MSSDEVAALESNELFVIRLYSMEASTQGAQELDDLCRFFEYQRIFDSRSRPKSMLRLKITISDIRISQDLKEPIGFRYETKRNQVDQVGWKKGTGNVGGDGSHGGSGGGNNGGRCGGGGRQL